MTDPNNLPYSKKMAYILNNHFDMAQGDCREALNYAVKCIDTVDKIKTEIAADFNEDCLDNIYIVLCESFGIDWEKEYPND